MPLLLGLPTAMLPPPRACEVGAFHALKMHPDLGGKEEALGVPGRANPYFLPRGLGRWEESQIVTSVDRGENGGRVQIWLFAFTEGVMWGGCVFSLESGR